jgi:hypothetical protein
MKLQDENNINAQSLILPAQASTPGSVLERVQY